MRPIRCAAFALVALTASTAAAAPAGIELRGALARHALAAANDSLASLDRALGTSFDSVHRGLGWGAALRLGGHDGVLVRFGYERVLLSAEDSGVRFDLGADSYFLGVSWFPPRAGRLRAGAGAAFGPWYANGGLRSDAYGFALDSKGNGFGGELCGEAVLPAGEGWSLGVAAGFRMARIWGLDYGDNRLDLAVDYSGPFLRATLAWDGGGDE